MEEIYKYISKEYSIDLALVKQDTYNSILSPTNQLTKKLSSITFKSEDTESKHSATSEISLGNKINFNL